jgi:Domain of unknown function (DUF4735)
MKVLLQQEMWITSSKFQPLAAIESADNEASLEDQPPDSSKFRSSDECLGQLLSGGTPCHISAECWEMQKIAPSEKFSYSTTHHLFYYHIAKKVSCKKGLAILIRISHATHFRSPIVVDFYGGHPPHKNSQIKLPSKHSLKGPFPFHGAKKSEIR